MRRMTWEWVEESVFPAAMVAASAAGMDVARWALDYRLGTTPSLVRLKTDGKPGRVLRHFTTPDEAAAFFDGVRLLALEMGPVDGQGRE